MYPICYNGDVNKIRYTAVYRIWYKELTDLRARVRIDLRLNSVKKGNLGDHRGVGNGIVELKIDYGPGYRVYCKRIGSNIVVLLCGGDKSSQEEDVKKAKRILKELEDGNL